MKATLTNFGSSGLIHIMLTVNPYKLLSLPFALLNSTIIKINYAFVTSASAFSIKVPGDLNSILSSALPRSIDAVAPTNSS